MFTAGHSSSAVTRPDSLEQGHDPVNRFRDDALASFLVGILAAVVGIHIMVDGDEVAFRADKHTFTDGDSSTPEKGAALLYEASFAYGYGVAVINIKRRKHGRAFIERFTEDTLQILMHFGRRPVTGVHFGRSLMVSKMSAISSSYP